MLDGQSRQRPKARHLAAPPSPRGRGGALYGSVGRLLVAGVAGASVNAQNRPRARDRGRFAICAVVQSTSALVMTVDNRMTHSSLGAIAA